MTVTARVNVVDRIDQVTLALERRIVAALDAAAVEAARVAEEKANTPRPIARFAVLRAHNIGDGYASGVKAGPLTRIFDHGSLGRRDKALKRGRKPAWEVNRGSNPYTAHRHDDLSGKGVAPRGILNAARRAGRAVLVDRLRLR